MLQQKPNPDATDGQYSFETVTTQVATCPDCDGDVVDGQGLLGCVDCEWAGIVA